MKQTKYISRHKMTNKLRKEMKKKGACRATATRIRQSNGKYKDVEFSFYDDLGDLMHRRIEKTKVFGKYCTHHWEVQTVI